MKGFICALLTAPAFMWIGFWFKLLEPELYADLQSFMSQREKWIGPDDACTHD